MEPGEPGRVFKDGVPFVGSLDRGLRTIPRTHRIVVALSERRGRLPIEALLEELERRYLLHVLEAVGGNRTRAAEVLQIDRRTLYRMAERFKIKLDGE